ncbi:hypothetical protein TWF594_003523 [Orbilia oligospora]|nr:hypothetical protein TWF594_003523 [Orbilia oligospora]
MDPVTGKLWTGGYEDREFMNEWQANLPISSASELIDENFTEPCEYWKLIRDISNWTHGWHLDSLTHFTRDTQASLPPPPPWITKLSREASPTLLAALLLERQQVFLNFSPCEKCKQRQKEKETITPEPQQTSKSGQTILYGDDDETMLSDSDNESENSKDCGSENHQVQRKDFGNTDFNLPDVTVTLDCLQRSTIFTAKSSNSHKPNDNPNDRLPLGFSLKSVSKVITSHNLTDFVTIRYYTFKGLRMGASQSNTNFMNIYNNEEFSDVIATVGTLGRGKKSYHLHQAIIRTFSEPLDTKCRAAPTEMGRKIITIDSWDYTIMDIVFRWMYGKNDLSGEQLDLPGVTMLIKVAQELEVKGLRQAALKTAVDIATSSIPTMHRNDEHWATYWDTVERICSLTNIRNFEDMDILFGLMEKLPIDKIQLDGARFKRLEESDIGLLIFLVSTAFGKIVEKTLCKNCQKLPVGKVTRSDSSHCSCCLKILPASKMNTVGSTLGFSDSAVTVSLTP